MVLALASVYVLKGEVRVVRYPGVKLKGERTRHAAGPTQDARPVYTTLNGTRNPGRQVGLRPQPEKRAAERGTGRTCS